MDHERTACGVIEKATEMCGEPVLEMLVHCTAHAGKLLLILGASSRAYLCPKYIRLRIAVCKCQPCLRCGAFVRAIFKQILAKIREPKLRVLNLVPEQADANPF